MKPMVSFEVCLCLCFPLWCRGLFQKKVVKIKCVRKVKTMRGKRMKTDSRWVTDANLRVVDSNPRKMGESKNQRKLAVNLAKLPTSLSVKLSYFYLQLYVS